MPITHSTADPLLNTGRKAVNPKTLANYEAGWRRYVSWCSEAGRDPLDGDAGQVCEFLVAMYRSGIKAGTLKLWRVAINYRYETDPALTGRENPAQDETVTKVLKNITDDAKEKARERGEKHDGIRKANKMTRSTLEKALAVSSLRRACESDEQAERRHAEMSAILPMMFDGLLRADEAASARWENLHTEPHPQTGHYRLHVPKTKTKKAKTVFVSRQTFEALLRWQAHPDADAEFIATARSANALSQRIRRLGDAAGVKLSGHSARRGAAYEMRGNGATEREMMDAGGWASSDMLSEYIDEADAAANGGMVKVYGNAEAEPEPGPVVGADFDPRDHRRGASTAALIMARRLGADRDHPAVAAERKRFLELWPADLDPPTDCARPGCPGFVFAIGDRPGERWCSIECQHDGRNRRKREARKRRERGEA